MNFETQVQQWITVDEQIKQLNEKTKELREKKNTLEENITTYASKYNLSETTIKQTNEKIKFCNTRVPEPLTFKYLEKTLEEIIKNESHRISIMNHIKQNRNIKIVKEIKRYYSK
jgi:seryl-tRNA synthetase